MTAAKALTDAQFEKANDAVDDALRKSKRGSPEREAAERLSEEWEKALAAPQRTFQQRQDRLALIAETAERLNLLL